MDEKPQATPERDPRWAILLVGVVATKEALKLAARSGWFEDPGSIRSLKRAEMFFELAFFCVILIGMATRRRAGRLTRATSMLLFGFCVAGEVAGASGFFGWLHGRGQAVEFSFIVGMVAAFGTLAIGLIAGLIGDLHRSTARDIQAKPDGRAAVRQPAYDEIA